MNEAYPYMIVVDEVGGREYAQEFVLRKLIELKRCTIGFLRHAVPLPLDILGKILKDLARIDYITYYPGCNMWAPTEEAKKWVSGI